MFDMEQLTKRQKAVYEFIRDKIRNRGYGPTVREIGENFDIASPNGVMCHLKALEKKGLITREPNMSRAIQLSYDEKGLPLSGRVAAGVMHEAIEQNERLDFEALFNNKRSNLFALKVSGDSMIEAAHRRWRLRDHSPPAQRAAGPNRRGPNPRWRSDAEMVLSREKQKTHPLATGQLGDGADLRERLPNPGRRFRRRAKSGLIGSPHS